MPYLLGALVFGALGACEPPRTLVPDSTAPPADTGVEMDSGVATDTGVDTGRPDVQRADSGMDAAMCDPDRCFDDCVAMGGVTGRCMSNMCTCRFPDSGTMGGDATTSDRADVPSESSFRGCMTNDQCPPTMFCSSSSCTGPGTCLLRQERDPNACLPDPAPSCGCDGLLYPSACARSTLGVRQDAMRRCMGDAAVIPPTDAASGGG